MRSRHGAAVLGSLLLVACSSTAPHPATPTATPRVPASPPATSQSAVPTPPAPPGPTAGALPTGFVPASATFITQSAGWVLGTAPCSGASCTSLLRTGDAGRTWESVPAPAAAVSRQLDSHARSSVDELRFADPVDGFAFGVALWTTHNSGTSWHQVPSVAGISPYLVSDLVASPNGVYLMVSGWDPRDGGETDGHYRLARGTASGDQFTVIDDFGSSVGYAPPGSLVASGATVYVVSAAANLVRVSGDTATAVTRPDPGCGGPLAASSATDLLLVCGGGAGGGSMGTRYLYGSTDGGATWTRMPDPGAGAGYDDAGAADGGGGHAVVGTVSGGGSGLLATLDYARTWTTILSFRDTGEGFVDLGFENAEQGIAIHGAVLYMTRDGGAHWAPVSFA